MRSSITRNSARLAHGPQQRARPSSCGHNAALKIVRDFHHNSRRLAQPPSNNRPDQSPTLVERTEEERRQQQQVDNGKEEEEREDEQAETTRATTETRKPLLRKTLRQRRSAVDTPPAPPAIPEWFYKYNVKLRLETASQEDIDNVGVQCIDGKTGHVLFTVPPSLLSRHKDKAKSWPMTPELSRLLNNNLKMEEPRDAKAKETGTREFNQSTHAEGRVQSATAPEPRDEEARPSLRKETRSSKESAISSSTGTIGGNFFNTHFTPLYPSPARQTDTGVSEPSRSTVSGPPAAHSGKAAETFEVPPPQTVSEQNDGADYVASASSNTDAGGSSVTRESVLAAMTRDLHALKHALVAEAVRKSLLTGDDEYERSWSAHLSPAERDEARTLQQLLRWIVLEVEMGLQAGMTVAADLPQASSFAATRVDISLLCPDPEAHEQMDHFAQTLARIADADLIRLDANDFAELTAEYVGRDADAPGTFATLAHDVFDGYAAVRGRDGELIERGREEDEEEIDEDEEDEDSPSSDLPSLPSLGASDGIRKAFREQPDLMGKLLGKVSVTGITLAMDPKMASSRSLGFRSASSSTPEVTWDDARLTALLESLIEAPQLKRSAQKTSHEQTPPSHNQDSALGRTLQKSANSSQSAIGTTVGAQLMTFRDWPSQVARSLYRHVCDIANPWMRLGSPLRADSQAGVMRSDDAADDKARHDFLVGVDDASKTSRQAREKRIVIHLRDLKDVCQRPLGAAIVRRLVRIVRTKRQAGYEIVILGTSAISLPSGTTDASEIMQYLSHETKDADLPFRQLVVPPMHRGGMIDTSKKVTTGQPQVTDAAYKRIYEINLRHIESMCRRLRLTNPPDLFTPDAQAVLSRNVSHNLSENVLTPDGIQRVVLMAIGLARTHAKSETVNAMHIGLATLIIERAHESVRNWAMSVQMRRVDALSRGVNADDQSPADKARQRTAELRKLCNQHEQKLLPGVVDPENIKVGFKEVHAARETIDSLKTLTSLALLRPDAFKYGILAQDRLTGLMLYGPPGTGKTLLAKAVAKECKAAVLEISGAQIYEKYVGEGEKMVRAVFTLAKKLAPCVVFLDEADALFGSRSSAGNRNTHREIINQFLREWDGVQANDVFIMVATNRPFDVDDAVLRRLPRRILVDLPVAQDREAILGIHLRDEQLEATVSLAALAQQTPFYSGSDLKNLCVAAALACVREESALAEQSGSDGSTGEKYTIPEKRTLTQAHFDQAFKEISASISEDMSTLTAIRKFDEQYGDGRGKKKKVEYGFGLGAATIDESAVRVRPSPSP